MQRFVPKWFLLLLLLLLLLFIQKWLCSTFWWWRWLWREFTLTTTTTIPLSFQVLTEPNQIMESNHFIRRRRLNRTTDADAVCCFCSLNNLFYPMGWDRLPLWWAYLLWLLLGNIEIAMMVDGWWLDVNLALSSHFLPSFLPFLLTVFRLRWRFRLCVVPTTWIHCAAASSVG